MSLQRSRTLSLNQFIRRNSDGAEDGLDKGRREEKRRTLTANDIKYLNMPSSTTSLSPTSEDDEDDVFSAPQYDSSHIRADLSAMFDEASTMRSQFIHRSFRFVDIISTSPSHLIAAS